jgi:hypothetical protein
VTLGTESNAVQHGEGFGAFYRPEGGEPSGQGGRGTTAGGGSLQ